MKKSKTKKIIVLFLLLLLATTTLTYAYLIDTQKIVNHADTEESSIDIIEEFTPPSGGDKTIPAGTNVHKEVRIRNNKAESFVRIYAELSDSAYEDKVVIDFDETNWIKQGTYWYYRKPLKKGEVTEPLMTTVHFLTNVPKGFEIICYAESVQAEGHKDVIEAFQAIQ